MAGTTKESIATKFYATSSPPSFGFTTASNTFILHPATPSPISPPFHPRIMPPPEIIVPAFSLRNRSGNKATTGPDFPHRKPQTYFHFKAVLPPPKPEREWFTQSKCYEIAKIFGSQCNISGKKIKKNEFSGKLKR
jgi:hypothetical protein